MSAMRTNRNHHVAVVGLVAAAALAATSVAASARTATGSAQHPVWSPDGRKVAYVVNADGSGRQTPGRPMPMAGVRSLDGRKIAFVNASDRGTPRANYDVYVMNADGSGQRRLTNSPANEGWFAWSPAHTGHGRSPASRTADTPAWEKALLARSDALNRYYGLGKYAGGRTKSVRHAAMPAWKRALIARSDALNRHYKLGTYADR
jgi:hypothetical protein